MFVTRAPSLPTSAPPCSHRARRSPSTSPVTDSSRSRLAKGLRRRLSARMASRLRRRSNRPVKSPLVASSFPPPPPAKSSTSPSTSPASCGPLRDRAMPMAPSLSVVRIPWRSPRALKSPALRSRSTPIASPSPVIFPLAPFSSPVSTSPSSRARPSLQTAAPSSSVATGRDPTESVRRSSPRSRLARRSTQGRAARPSSGPTSRTRRASPP